MLPLAPLLSLQPHQPPPFYHATPRLLPIPQPEKVGHPQKRCVILERFHEHGLLEPGEEEESAAELVELVQGVLDPQAVDE